MPSMTSAKREALRQVERDLHQHLIASENWNGRYTKNPKLFRRLVAAEAKMDQDMREYFLHLPERVHNLINWPEMQRRQSQTASAKKRTKFAEDVVVTIDNGAWDEEATMMYAILSPSITEAATVGGLIAEEGLKVNVGWGSGNATMLKAVRTHTLELARGLNQTTKDNLKEILLHGLASGKTSQQIVDEILNNPDNPISSPYRAEMIARTEAVRAATLGTLALADEAGTEFKVWDDGQAGECEICLSISPKRIPVDESFSDGSDGPPAHPHCRCGMSLDYANDKERAALADGSYDPSEDYGDS